MHAMARRAIQASLLEDVRGSAIEKVVVVAFFVLVGAAGVRHLGSVTEKTLTCQGQAIQRADGTVACVGSAVGQGVPGPVAGVTNPEGPLASNAAACVGLQCLCFVAGTTVMTAAGLRAIETIERGTLVLSRDDDGA